MERIEELNLKINELEKELNELKNERMALTAESAAKLLKFEYAELKRRMRNDDEFSYWLFIKKYPRQEHCDPRDDAYFGDRRCFSDVTVKAILVATNDRTEKFEEMILEEKMKLRDIVKKELEKIYAEYYESR